MPVSGINGVQAYASVPAELSNNNTQHEQELFAAQEIGYNDAVSFNTGVQNPYEALADSVSIPQNAVNIFEFCQMP